MEEYSPNATRCLENATDSYGWLPSRYGVVNQLSEKHNYVVTFTQAWPLTGRHLQRKEVNAVDDSERASAGRDSAAESNPVERIGGVLPQGAPKSHLATLHETFASLLASRGQWKEAYEHLRSALDLVQHNPVELSLLPDQLRREVDQLRREHAEAREQSLRDSLTASYNRRYLDQRLVTLLDEQSGSPHGIAVALVDLDWFKQVNDSYGHLIGDQVLRQVVELLQIGLPQGAFCARYGGEEFALVMPDIQAPVAIGVSEAARARVERYTWQTIATGLRVTVSIGVAHERTGTGIGAEQQLREADNLLYAAKQSGRNAVAYQERGRTWLAGGAAGRRTVLGDPFTESDTEHRPRVAGYN